MQTGPARSTQSSPKTSRSVAQRATTATPSRAQPAFSTIAAAAERLGVDAALLRARCRRKGQRVGDCVVALVSDDVVAFKFGPRWRLRFKGA
jgi:hypothetical protein